MMRDTGNKKKIEGKQRDEEVDRRKFIEKSARDIGAYSFAIFEIAKTIKDEIIQEVVDDIKETIRRS